MRSSSDRVPGSALAALVGVEALDRLLEAVAPDEPHGVVGAAVVVAAQAVDRDDPRMLQAAGDLGLEQESLPAVRVVGVIVEDLLERHLTIQLGVESDVNGPQSAPRMRPQHPESEALGGGRAGAVSSGPLSVSLLRGRGQERDPHAELRVAEPP